MLFNNFYFIQSSSWMPSICSKCNTDTRIKQISVHSSTSKLFEVLQLRISLTISSAVRSSFQTPAKRLAQLVDVLLFLSLLTIELLNKDIKSSFSLLLRFFSSPQYGGIYEDDVVFLKALISSFYYSHRQKYKLFSNLQILREI